MKLYRKIDTDGLFVEDVLLESIPNLTETVINEDGTTAEVDVVDPEGKVVPSPYYIETPCPGGFYKPMWDRKLNDWIEGGSAPPVTNDIVDPDVELAEAISAATTVEELKSALLGKTSLAKVKGIRRNE
jgi:hypothetical protein